MSNTEAVEIPVQSGVESVTKIAELPEDQATASPS